MKLHELFEHSKDSIPDDQTILRQMSIEFDEEYGDPRLPEYMHLDKGSIVNTAAGLYKTMVPRSIGKAMRNAKKHYDKQHSRTDKQKDKKKAAQTQPAVQPKSTDNNKVKRSSTSTKFSSIIPNLKGPLGKIQQAYGKGANWADKFTKPPK